MSAATPQLSRRTKLLFSTGDLSTSIPLAILMFFQLYFLTDVAGLRPDLAGLAVGIPRIWDAVNDPLIGLLSDRLRSPWGRRRVLLLFGSVPLGLSFIFMWLVPNLGQIGLAFYYAIIFVLFDTAFTTPLVELGYADAEAQKDALAAFFHDGQFGIGVGTVVLLVNAALLGTPLP